MRQFFLVNQQHTAQSEQFGSQTDDSYQQVLFSQSNTFFTTKCKLMTGGSYDSLYLKIHIMSFVSSILRYLSNFFSCVVLFFYELNSIVFFYEQLAMELLLFFWYLFHKNSKIIFSGTFKVSVRGIKTGKSSEPIPNNKSQS